MRTNALDWVNFFLADVRGGMGAYVNVLLFTEAQWSQAEIGAVLTISGLIGVTAHPFIGNFIDQTRAKRLAIVGGVFLLSCSGLAIVFWPIIPVVIVSDVTMAVLGGVFAPTVAAITLGLYGSEDLPARMGRNAAFDRAGNVFIAVFFGVVGVASSQKAPFYFVPVFAALAAVAALSIPARAIDHERARGAASITTAKRWPPPNWRVLLKYRPLLIFAGAATLFHFANAPMLPLVAQKMALANPGWESGFTSTAIIVTQSVTILAAMLVVRANRIGRKPLLVLAFAALPLRAALCALSDDAFSLLAIQALDGLGGGLFEALLPLVLADIMTGTSHYSLARGVLGAIQGVGGSLSQGAAGLVVTAAGYPSAFLALGAVACAGLLVILAAMPETTPRSG
jgi:MFS family permease